MRHKRHCVIKIARPSGFCPSAPTEIPASIVAIPRIDLGRAAAEAIRLNGEEIARGKQAAFLFLPVKCFQGAGAPLPSHADAPTPAVPASAPAAACECHSAASDSAELPRVVVWIAATCYRSGGRIFDCKVCSISLARKEADHWAATFNRINAGRLRDGVDSVAYVYSETIAVRGLEAPATASRSGRRLRWPLPR